MPIISIKKKSIDKIKKLPKEKLEEVITLMGLSLEDYGEEIKIEAFPNRPDILSEPGFLRYFKTFLGIEQPKEYKAIPSKEKVIIELSVDEIRPYTACAIVKDLNFNEEKIKEIIDLQEKLHLNYGRNRKKVAIGIYPMEKINFPITFKAIEPEKIRFIPLESNEEMNGLQILSKHPTGREYGHLLQGLKKFPIFVDAKGEILSMPPIINSDTTGKITEKTKEVFIECSGFNFKILKKCLNIIVCCLADMGGKIYSVILEKNNKK